ncbi:hypothetical protein A5804_002098 [Enterococcus faecium]|uniref:DUF1642 domain-containing protein n=1 Tax=Enterococcus faecium TaxID=1352 RepID=A0AB73PPG4_ENTFC|nr:DUF1642 domain-containing protein [Enterococcus faecium]OTO00586.1 hypothetical protein A5804_002098 [Enterococcus faecium]
MNKQEQKNKLWALKWIDKEIEENERHAHQKTGTEANTSYWKGYVASCKNIRYIVKELDEPQKPVVPQFVAEWFEEHKDDLDNAIFGYLVFWEERDISSDLYQWFAKSKNKPIETLVRMKDGYEVKKEPLYRVKLGEGYFVEYQGRGALLMIIPDDNKEIKIFDSKSDAERTAQTIGGTVEEVAEG